MYRVFLGAPSKNDPEDPDSYHWKITWFKRTTSASQSVVFPAATLEAASRRISLIYQNIIFTDNADDQDWDMENDTDAGGDITQDQTTVITWLPSEGAEITKPDLTRPSFLDRSGFRQAQTQYETQETQETQSYDYSDASSITRFPKFHFSLHILTSISSLSKSGFKGSRKVTVLLAALEVDGPDTITIKKGPDAGKDVSILKMILGDDEGTVCKLTAWREIAETWGGAGEATAVKRGDILLIENIMATFDTTSSPSLSASPYLKSKAEICYRTMPFTKEDNQLRPDLRLGESDASVRKVATVARWFEGMAGLAVAT